MGPIPHLSLCACKTTRLTSEILVSMGPSLHLWFLHAKLRLYDQNYKSLWDPALICLFISFTTASLRPELIVSKGPRPHLSLCACKTTRIASELLVSMDPSHHLRFLHAKQRLLDQNYKSLWVPDLT